MNNLEKYLDQVIEQKPIVYEAPAEVQETPPQTNMLESVRRRWYIVLGVALAICAVGLPAMWYLVEPVFIVRGTIQIRQTVPSVVTGEPLTDNTGSYTSFVNTQVVRLMNDPMLLGKVLDDLGPRGLAFFRGEPSSRVERLLAKIIREDMPPSPDEILRRTIMSQNLTASYIGNTELIAVTMRSHEDKEAKTIVDSFLRNFEAQYRVQVIQSDSDTVVQLETQQRQLRTRVENQRNLMQAAAEDAAPTILDPNERLLQQLEMNRLSLLLSEHTRLDAQRIQLETEIGAYDPNREIATPEEIVAARSAHVNADPMVAELSTNIVQLERDLIIAQQTQTLANPILQQRQAVLDALIARRDQLRNTLEEEFDADRREKLAEATEYRKRQAPEALKQIQARLDQVNTMLDDQKKRLTRVAQDKLKAEGLNVDLKLDEEMLNQVTRRKGLLEMERDRRPRVQIFNLAQTVGEEDRRVKLAGMIVFGAVACGMGLAFLRDKLDKTLQTPADVARQTDLPILGTTTSSRTVKPALFAEQIAGDYQTIRTNLGLLYNGGTPKRLVISSAGMREGKTTFAVNLATSLAKAGKKVLLIDGDLRKPDIGHMLNVLNTTGGIQNVLLGEDPANIICVLPSSGLHVLATNPRHLGDAYELLTAPTAAEQMERLSREYDHLIVDTPPTLAFPDALVWAKLTDAVILVSFAGQTTAPDLKEAKERFARIRARILGAVLSNVPVDQGLYRQSYTYRSQGASASRKSGKPKKLLLTTPAQTNGDQPKEA